MVGEFRVPVTRLDAHLLTDDGETHQVTVFLPPGEDLGRLFDGLQPFLPVSEEGRIRLYARETIAAIAARGAADPETAPGDDQEMLTEKRELIVKLRGGAVLQGTLRFGWMQSKPRTADLLNDATPTFTLDVAGAQYRIAKAHVATVDEV